MLRRTNFIKLTKGKSLTAPKLRWTLEKKLMYFGNNVEHWAIDLRCLSKSANIFENNGFCFSGTREACIAEDMIYTTCFSCGGKGDGHQALKSEL